MPWCFDPSIFSLEAETALKFAPLKALFKMSGKIAAQYVGVLFLAVAGSSISCQSMPASDAAEGPSLEFSVLGQAEPARERAPTIARVSPGSVQVTGAIGTPTPCYTIDAGLDAKERALTLTLTASARDGACIQILAAFEYRATISGLESGSYTILVAQTYPGTGWPRREHRLELSSR